MKETSSHGPACHASAPVAIDAIGVDATIATIIPGQSSLNLSFHGQRGAFQPVGTIAFGGGFQCDAAGCPMAFESIDVQSPSSFSVGNTTVSSMEFIANGGFTAEVADGVVALTGSPPDLSATTVIDGTQFSRNGTPDSFSGTLDNNARMLTLSGELASPDGTASFSLVASLGDSPPVAEIEAPATGECGVPIPLSADGSFDPDGQAINSYQWFEFFVDGGIGSLGTGEAIASAFQVGQHEIAVVVQDDGNQVGASAVFVNVADTIPPKIASVAVDPSCLWPPNHEMVPFDLGNEIQVTVQDACDPQPAVTFTGASSSEASAAVGSGDTSPDVFVDAHTACLRSERAGTGNGRNYTIDIQALNRNGLESSTTAVVTVPHDERGSTRCAALPPEMFVPDGDPRCSALPAPGGGQPDGGGADPLYQRQGTSIATTGCAATNDAGAGSCGALAFAVLALRRRRFRRG